MSIKDKLERAKMIETNLEDISRYKQRLSDGVRYKANTRWEIVCQGFCVRVPPEIGLKFAKDSIRHYKQMEVDLKAELALLFNEKQTENG